MRAAILIMHRLPVALALWRVAALVVGVVALLCAVVAVTLLAVAVVVVTGHLKDCVYSREQNQEGVGTMYGEGCARGKADS